MDKSYLERFREAFVAGYDAGRRLTALQAVQAGVVKRRLARAMRVSRPTLDAWLKRAREERDG